MRERSDLSELSHPSGPPGLERLVFVCRGGIPQSRPAFAAAVDTDSSEQLQSFHLYWWTALAEQCRQRSRASSGWRHPSILYKPGHSTPLLARYRLADL